MPELGITIDPDTKPDTGREFTPIPSGTYLAMITGSEVKDTRAGDGSYAKFEFTVVDGQYQGRKVWHQATLRNPNEEAEKIGRAQIMAISLSAGLTRPMQQTEDVHDKPMQIVVGIKPASGQYQAQNKITKFASVNAAIAPAAPAPIGATASSAPSNPPWKR